MNTEKIVAGRIWETRRMYSKFSSDPHFYDAKYYLRKRLQATFGVDFVVELVGRRIRVCYGDKMVVV